MLLRLGNATESVALELPARLYRNKSEAPYEGNSIEVSIAVGSWRSMPIKMNLLTNELLDFLQSLSRLFKTLDGNATLRSIENWLELNVKANRLGGVTVSGSAKDSDLGNRLNFSLTSDQSFYAKFTERVEEYLRDQGFD